MTSKKREQIYKKYGGRCAYTGTPLKDDWQVDHIIPKRRGGTDDINNLVPAQRIVNHYKRALSLEKFRVLWLGGLHNRLKKLPKNPKVAKSIRRKEYLLEVADLFGITPDKPFSGVFYFEREE
jgi:5-methylcytosine-specific restriction endonuclease McrA